MTRVKSILLWCAKLVLLPVCELVALVLGRLPGDMAHGVFYRHGFHLLRKHYFLPIPDEEDLGAGFWDSRSDMVGVEMNDRHALHLVEEVFPPYLLEFSESFPLRETPGRPGFHLVNGTFMAGDAHVYYSLVRHLKPKRIVEIGSGASTLVAAAACQRNLAQGGQPAELVAVEPFPVASLRQGLAGLTRLIEDRVQNVDPGLFSSLQSGDILFIDSSHALRTGGDVQLEYCEILPRLAPGVLIHLHDISLPRPYPRVYFDQQLYWNEQYLLQVLLSYSSRYEVVWPGSYLMLKYPDRLASAFPGYQEMLQSFPRAEPSSFWIRVRSPG